MLTTLKFAAFVWLCLLVTGLLLLAVVYLFDLLMRLIRARLARRR